MILVDTGPLVALFRESDQHHAACVAAARRLPRPLWTVWPVVTEAAFMLPLQAQARLWSWFATGVLRLAALDETDLPRIHAFMEKYQDLPMDFADAALVRVAERERIRRVFTVDRKDFSIYRPERIGRLAIVP